MEYKNKTVWITGASSGIGRALAKRFSKENANIILSSRNISELETLKSEIEIDSNKVVIEALDLTKQDTFKDIVTKVISEFGSIDLLINNGGISQRSLVEETSLDVDRKLMEVNFFGTVALTKAVLPYMLKQEKGQIAVVTSVVGKFGFPLRSAYSASKHALQGFFDTLRAETHERGILVSIIIPGRIKTNISVEAIVADGSTHGKMDAGQEKGMGVEEAAEKMFIGLKKEKKEILVGRKELIMVQIRRFFPFIYYRMVSKVRAT
ncbi:MAG: SDR family oxidoreductase [Flavobacteriales bacterium]|nr:SDR family oxidoreductase [Flavobacteriales bacterium]